MTYSSTLSSVITSVGNNKATLEALLGQVQSETIQSDNPTLYPAPTYNASTNEWTITQSTANVNGVYEGVYKLPGTGTCSNLQIVEVTAHQNPTTGAPAKYKDCDGSAWIDETAVDDLDGKRVTQFTIRSAAPFTIKLRVSATWCYTLDFTVSSGGFTTMYSQSPEPTGVWTSGSGWRSGSNGCQYGPCAQLYISRTVAFAPTVVSLKVWFSGLPYTPSNSGNLLQVWGKSLNLEAGSPLEYASTGETFPTTFQIICGSYTDYGGGSSFMTTISKIEICGIDDNPFI